MTTLLLTALAILFLSALVKTTLGFGEALLAMPLLTLTLGLGSATPIVGLMGLILTTLMIRDQWRQIELRATWRLLAAAGIGIPIGILLMRWVPATLAKQVLGLVLIGFGAFSLWRPNMAASPWLQHPLWAYLFGFLAGVFGSAYNTSGPPLVLYSALRGWPPAQFRATMQSFFLPVSLLIVGTHAAAGMWTAPVLTIILLAVPLLLLAVQIGALLQRRIATERFSQLVYAALMVLGLLLLR